MLFVFLILALGFADWLIGLFGPAFVEEGAMPLRVLAVTAAITMVVGLAPTYLKYTRQDRTIHSTLIVAGAGQIALLAILVPRHGATGAAVAHATSMIGMYVTFAALAWRDLRGRARAKAW